MFIKFDDSDMLDFFEKEPISIGEEDAAIFMYSIEDSSRFSMTLTIDTYAKQIHIFIEYNNNTIFSGQFDNVLEIKKSDDVLLVDVGGQKRLVIKKFICILEKLGDIQLNLLLNKRKR